MTTSLKCQGMVSVPSLADQYRPRTERKGNAIFELHPDARVLVVAPKFVDPAATPMLNAGVGPGRNALPLARLGFPVDAIELTPEFADRMEAAAFSESLGVRVLRGNLFDPAMNN